MLLGLLGAAVVLVIAAWSNLHLECEFPGTDECLFEVATAARLARLQGAAALGLLLLGSGGLVLFTRRSP